MTCIGDHIHSIFLVTGTPFSFHLFKISMSTVNLINAVLLSMAIDPHIIILVHKHSVTSPCREYRSGSLAIYTKSVVGVALHIVVILIQGLSLRTVDYFLGGKKMHLSHAPLRSVCQRLYTSAPMDPTLPQISNLI